MRCGASREVLGFRKNGLAWEGGQWRRIRRACRVADFSAERGQWQARRRPLQRLARPALRELPPSLPGLRISKALLSDYAVGTVDTADSAHLLVTRTSSSPDLEAYVGVSINGPGVTSALHGPTPVRIGDRLVCAGTAEAGRLDASNVQIIYQIVEGQWSMHPTPAVVLPAGRVPISSSTHLRRSDMSPVDSSGMSDGEAVAATARVNQITGDTTLLIVAAHS